ncbi:hypothetical protein LCGC14_2207620 [marine sediment metagenome]|uniref:Uncharacterized protein n=1 Tax=marine sediment metagenome TaxID=412755 RepID=A0A0F9FS38_9ZZZZ
MNDIKCPYCNEFKGNSKVRGYPIKDQLRRHIEVDHRDRISNHTRPRLNGGALLLCDTLTLSHCMTSGDTEPVPARWL